MKFVKMEGLGNDYVYVDGFETAVADPGALAKAVSDRHFGVGADGLILLVPDDDGADLKMEMWNSDGSKSEMCGNGLRCVAYLAKRLGLVDRNEMTVATGAGRLSLAILSEDDAAGAAIVRMDMGVPRLERSEIPMLGAPGRVIDEALEVNGGTVSVTAVSMGNPHAVVFVPDLGAYPVERMGPAIETHPAFPNRVNASFVEVRSPEEVVQRTWERGAGETMACGTGAAAVTVAGILTGRVRSPLLLHLPGGDLQVSWDGEGRVLQTGPAKIVFEGEWPE